MGRQIYMYMDSLSLSIYIYGLYINVDFIYICISWTIYIYTLLHIMWGRSWVVMVGVGVCFGSCRRFRALYVGSFGEIGTI